MLQGIKQTVLNKILLSSCLIVSSVFSNDELDISKNNIIKKDIVIGKYNIFNFPFKIEKFRTQIKSVKQVKSTSILNQDIVKIKPISENLLESETKEENKSLKKLPTLVKNANDRKKEDAVLPKVSQKKKPKTIAVVNDNILEIFPKKEAEYEIIVFGGSKPVILSLSAKNFINMDKEEDRYFEIKDRDLKISQEDKNLIMSNSSSDFLNIFRNLYVNKELVGFDVDDEKKETISMYDGKLISELKKYYYSEKFEVKEYLLSSSLPIDLYINEDDFSNENTVSISFDTQDNFLYQNNTIRYFVINRIYQ